MRWYESLIGKPWARIPEPPQSFTCGELGRYVFRERLGLETPLVYADPARLDQCIDNLECPEAYGLYPFAGQPRPYDIAYMIRRVKRDHLGIAVRTTEGLMILHCLRGVGVILESEMDILGSTGARRIEWRRHKDIPEELALCRA